MKSIKSRLVFGLSLIIVFFLAQAALLWWGQSVTKDEVVETAKRNTQASSQLTELAVLAQQIRRYEKEFFVYVADADRRGKYVGEWTGTFEKMTQLIATLRSNPADAFSVADLGEIANWSAANDFYGLEMRRIFKAVDDQAVRVEEFNTRQGAVSVQSQGAADGASLAALTPAVVMFSPIEVNGQISAGKDRLSGVLIKGVAAMSKEKTRQTLSLAEVAEGGFNKVFYGVVATVAVGVLVALSLMVSLPKAVTAPLVQLTKAVENLSTGQLDKKIDVGSVTEFAGLAVALERLRIGQQALVARMRRSA